MTAPQPEHNAEQAKKSAPQRAPAAPANTWSGAGVSSAELQAAINDPLNARPQAILQLQRMAGNRAVAQLIQRKMTVGPADDHYEQEADRVAGQVMLTTPSAPLQRLQERERQAASAASITPLVQRDITEDEELQAKSIAEGGAFAPGADFETRLAAQQSGGQPLPNDTRTFMESRFGADFGGVRIHADGQAHQLNDAIQARAFTTGQDIFFREGAYQPGSHDGQKLLAHELTHTIQQGAVSGRDPQSARPAAPVETVPAVADLASTDYRLSSLAHTAIPLQEKLVTHSHFPVQRIIDRDAAPGTRVINEKTKNIFIITAYLPEEKWYKLQHAIQMYTTDASAYDENYNVFAQPDLQPEPVKSPNLLSSISSLLGRSSSSKPVSISGFYEEARKEDIAKAWPSISKEVQAIKAEAIKLEQTKPGSVAFYNAADLSSHALHRMIREIYEAVHQVQTQNHVFFRAPGNPPRQEARQNPQNFLATRKSPGWSDHRETDSMMSANISVSANPVDSAESTFSLLQSGGLFDLDPKKTVAIVRSMLKSMGIPENYLAIILTEVEKLAKAINRIKDNNRRSRIQEAVLYQTFIPKSLISKLVYISQVNGLPLDATGTLEPNLVLQGIANAGKELKNSEMESFGRRNVQKYDNMEPKEKELLFHSNDFTHMVLEAAKSTLFWRALNKRRDPQARILLHPKVFVEPSGLTETVTHANISPETSKVLEQGLSRIRMSASEAGVCRDLISRITDSIDIYGIVYLKFNNLGSRLSEMPLENLREIWASIRQISSEVDEKIQTQVWDFIGEHDALKDQIRNDLEVMCRGKSTRFDIFVPARMFPNELQELIHLLHELKDGPRKPQEIEDLLIF